MSSRTVSNIELGVSANPQSAGILDMHRLCQPTEREMLETLGFIDLEMPKASGVAGSSDELLCVFEGMSYRYFYVRSEDEPTCFIISRFVGDGHGLLRQRVLQATTCTM